MICPTFWNRCQDICCAITRVGRCFVQDGVVKGFLRSAKKKGLNSQRPGSFIA
jgi:hypothetical protein